MISERDLEPFNCSQFFMNTTIFSQFLLTLLFKDSEGKISWKIAITNTSISRLTVT